MPAKKGSTVKKSAAKTPEKKESAAKRPSVKESAAKKPSVKESATKKSLAKDSGAKKSSAKESAAKKSPVKESTAKKPSAKASVANEQAANAPSTRKPAAEHRDKGSARRDESASGPGAPARRPSAKGTSGQSARGASGEKSPAPESARAPGRRPAARRVLAAVAMPSITPAPAPQDAEDATADATSIALKSSRTERADPGQRDPRSPKPAQGRAIGDAFASDEPSSSDKPLISNLTSHFLLALPGLSDPNFHGAIVLVAEHNERGALGLMINKPAAMDLAALLSRIEVDSKGVRLDGTPVYVGGPVQTDRGFVLHEAVQTYGATMTIGEDILLTTSKDVLESVARGEGPARMLVALGYAGWGPGQLEAEIAENVWLTMPADSGILFDVPPERRFASAYETLGIDPALIAPSAGHA